MENLAADLFEAHQNPIVKLNMNGTKIYLPNNTEQENALVSSNIDILKNTIKFPRVDRRHNLTKLLKPGLFNFNFRCDRSLAIWLEDKSLAKVIKKHFQNFGFQDKTGIYLFPEEALFLLETNRLEILWEGVPVNIQQAFSLLLINDICSLEKYKVYKKLAFQGFKISKPGKQISDNFEPGHKKLKLDENLISNSISCNLSERTSDKKADTSDRKADTSVNKFVKQSLTHCDYNICSSKTKNHYNICIIENSELDPNLGTQSDKAQNIHGIPLADNVTFYKFNKVNIPDISNDTY